MRGPTLTPRKTAPVRGQRPEAARNARRRLSAAGLAAVMAAGLVTGCAAGAASPHPAAAGEHPAAGLAVPPGSQVRVPRPDYARPASVAAAFYVAWASTDAVHDQPGTYLARCAPLVTAALERQLAASQPAPFAWQAMRGARLVSLVRVQAVGRGRGDGITVELTRSGGRWLVSAVLFY